MSLSVKGQESTFDLRELSLGDACRLGSWVRDLETVGKSSEEVCQLIAMFLARSFCSCLLYTSDAADERSSVDFGGSRILKKKIKKKKKREKSTKAN